MPRSASKCKALVVSKILLITLRLPRRHLDFRDFRQSNYYIILISVYGYHSEGNLPITNMWTEFGEL